MPNCFQLIDKKTGKAADLREIDTALWIHFNGHEPEGNSAWYKGWYNTIGLLLSCGKSFDEIKEIYFDDQLYQSIIDRLSCSYESSAWYSSR